MAEGAHQEDGVAAHALQQGLLAHHLQHAVGHQHLEIPAGLPCQQNLWAASRPQPCGLRPGCPEDSKLPQTTHSEQGMEKLEFGWELSNLWFPQKSEGEVLC